MIAGENENDTKSAKNGHVEETLDYEFNLWTKHDCHGTEYENSNRTWFYFGVKAAKSGALVRLNVINLNKQVKMFSQGMCPVYKVLPGHPQWERIRDKPIYAVNILQKLVPFATTNEPFSSKNRLIFESIWLQKSTAF